MLQLRDRVLIDLLSTCNQATLTHVMVACSLALTVHQELVQAVIVSVYLHPSRIHWVQSFWGVNEAVGLTGPLIPDNRQAIQGLSVLQLPSSPWGPMGNMHVDCSCSHCSLCVVGALGDVVEFDGIGEGLGGRRGLHVTQDTQVVGIDHAVARWQ